MINENQFFKKIKILYYDILILIIIFIYILFKVNNLDKSNSIYEKMQYIIFCDNVLNMFGVLDLIKFK